MINRFPGLVNECWDQLTVWLKQQISSMQHHAQARPKHQESSHGVSHLQLVERSSHTANSKGQVEFCDSTNFFSAGRSPQRSIQAVTLGDDVMSAPIMPSQWTTH